MKNIFNGVTDSLVRLVIQYVKLTLHVLCRHCLCIILSRTIIYYSDDRVELSDAISCCEGSLSEITSCLRYHKVYAHT